MYTTMPLSLYRNNPAALSKYPPEAPNSGYLVATDEESREMDSFCWGVYQHDRITRLPFPQDRILKVVHVSEYDKDSVKKVWFIPVLDHPLSSNRYYVIKANGKHKGRAYVCARDMAVRTCCFESDTEELKPRQFNHKDVYQQFEICPYFNGGFYARAVAWDGIAPKFLRRKGWEVHISHSFTGIHLKEAQGLNPFHPHDIPELKAPISSKRSTAVIIGKWYCPFAFVQEQKEQQMMKKSLLYEVALKRWWEEIYACDNESNRSAGNVVAIDARVKKLLTLIDGVEASREPKTGPHEEFVWFSTAKEGYERRVGLSSAIVEQLRWLQEKRGWFGDGECDVRVEGTEEIKSESGWRRFGCYVLVESFVMRRMDGSLLINFNCRNTRKIICTWE